MECEANKRGAVLCRLAVNYEHEQSHLFEAKSFALKELGEAMDDTFYDCEAPADLI